MVQYFWIVGLSFCCVKELCWAQFMISALCVVCDRYLYSMSNNVIFKWAIIYFIDVENSLAQTIIAWQESATPALRLKDVEIQNKREIARQKK